MEKFSFKEGVSMREEYVTCNKYYQIEKATDDASYLGDHYYNVYNKKDMQVEISFAYLKSAKEYIKEVSNDRDK